MGNALGSGWDVELGSQGPPTPYVDPGFLDPYAHVPKPTRPMFPPATTAERLASVFVDFVVLKLITTSIVIAIAGVNMLAMAGGNDEQAAIGANSPWALVLSAGVAFVYFVLWPARFHGRTIGRRVLGIGPGISSGADARGGAVARHDFFVFFLPSLALDPITVLGWRDFAVLAVWCGVQVWRTTANRTRYEESLGFGMIERPI